MKKYFVSLIIFTIIVMLSPMVFAATDEKFEVVDDQVCTIKINDYCEFEKKMTSYDLDKRQVTIQLKITNNSIESQPTGEVMLVLDNSTSMDDVVGNTTRGDMVFNSAKTLVSKMLKDNDKLKVGIVRFSTVNNAPEGTLADASLVSELSTDATALNTAIDSIQKDGPRTDLDAGLTLASQHFSNADTNKYIIVLTDGVPNIALDAANSYYSQDVINKTKSKLQSLASNYNLITLLTGINVPTTPAGAQAYDLDYVIKNIFGTADNPTAGKFYYISDNEIEQTITNSIYNDLLPQSQSVKDIKINDFFPQKIVDNFEFAYVSEPTKGTITKSIDSENKIVWSIDELASGETATVKYTLTLKDNYNPNIANIILDTNEKVDITYKDFDGTDKSKTSDETPKVRIIVDTAPVELPKAGKIVLISIVTLLFGFAIISGTGILKNKD